MTYTIEDLVAAERKITTEMTDIQAKLDELDEQRTAIRQAILDLMKEQGVESSRTKYGTVTRTISERFWTSDWSAMHQFILDRGIPELLEKRIQQTNMRQWIDNHPNDFPPGVNVDRKYTVTIRKPKKGANDEG